MKNNGYSKISSDSDGGHKSRSMDFSYFLFSSSASAIPQIPKLPPPSRRMEGINSSSASSSITHNRGSIPENENENEEPAAADSINKPPQQRKRQNNNNSEIAERELDHESNGTGERLAVVLGRSSSVSFSSSMKRAFAMRRSSSVSERYCRIHDQYMAIASPPLEENEDEIIGTTRSKNKKKLIFNRGANIFKACKRILRL